MKFFMPLTVGLREADQLYRQSVGRVTSIGFEGSPCRIYKLVYWTNHQLIRQQVGDLAINGELIASHLKSEVGYFVGAYSSNQASGESIFIHYVTLVVDTVVDWPEEFD